MKKINLFLILVLYCSSITPLLSQIRWYAEGGLNYLLLSDYESTTNGELYSTNPDVYMIKAYKEEYKNKIESQWTVGVRLQKKWIELDMGLEYSRIRFEIQGQSATHFVSLSSFNEYPRLNSFTVDLSLRYLSLPVMINAHTSNNLLAIGIGLVPQVYIPPTTMHSMYGGVRSYCCALQAQVKCQISSRFALVGAYRQNVTKLYDSDFPLPSDTKAKTVRLSLRYYFGKKV